VYQKVKSTKSGQRECMEIAKAPMLSLYRTLIRSITDYGVEVYFSSSKADRTTIKRIQNQALRLCTGTVA